jgi:hypothetical protein
LYKLLRPEFVLKYPQRLCSDGISPFVKDQPDAKEHENELQEARLYLFSTVIPKFAQMLDQQDSHKPFALILELHSAGINVRHLGKRIGNRCILIN